MYGVIDVVLINGEGMQTRQTLALGSFSRRFNFPRKPLSRKWSSTNRQPRKLFAVLEMNPMNGPGGPAAIWQEARNTEGRVYYYNVQTKATQWAKPVDLMTPVEVGDLRVI
jgi:hypothetical protein